jgi:tRNA (cmo5U34)-methyltransferase
LHPDDHHPVQPFGAEHAAQYDARASTTLPGQQAMREVVAATVATALKGHAAATVLCVGVGTGLELLPLARHGAPAWRFTGVDTSPHMLAVARDRLVREGLQDRVRLHEGPLQGLEAEEPFDAAQMIGVLHHVHGDEARLALLREVVRRLKPGAPFLIGERVGADPLLLDVEDAVLQAAGAAPEAVSHRRRKLVHHAVPASDQAFFALLGEAGLVEPRLLFAVLQFKVFLVRSGARMP